LITTDTTAQCGTPAVPAPHPWLADFGYDDVTARYAQMAADSRAFHDEWDAVARSRVFPRRTTPAAQPLRPRSHASAQVTAPDIQVPAPVPPQRPSRWRARFHSGKAVGEGWQQDGPRGRHARTEGTPGNPAAASELDDTILPGQVPAFAAAPAEDDLAAAAVQQQSNAALMRAGAKPADLEHLARPGDGRDLPDQMTVLPVPQQGERQ
jgi:hypothetical protein